MEQLVSSPVVDLSQATQGLEEIDALRKIQEAHIDSVVELMDLAVAAAACMSASGCASAAV